MKLLSLLFLFIIFNSYAAIDKTKYYSVFESNSLEKIEAEIIVLKKQKTSAEKSAFLGAMIMKKSQFMKTPKEKIATFKEGKNLLEEVIRQYPNNSTYRFLRLAIQENCPKILKYNTQIHSDSQFIQMNFNTMDSITKKFVKNYSTTSKALTL